MISPSSRSQAEHSASELHPDKIWLKSKVLNLVLQVQSLSCDLYTTLQNLVAVERIKLPFPGPKPSVLSLDHAAVMVTVERFELSFLLVKSQLQYRSATQS